MPEFGHACVVFKGGSRTIEILVSRSLSEQGQICCALHVSNAQSALPEGFRKEVDVDLASSIVYKILTDDSLAALRFRSGRLVKLQIPIHDPISNPGSPNDFDDVRRRAQTLGAMVRPCLLDTLAGYDKLYGYQQFGANWLAGRRAGILADEMGLGKTAQAIAAIRQEFRDHPRNTGLVVCPKNLLANWEKEISHWAPELSWSRLTPPSRWRTNAWQYLFNKVHLILTNYEQVGSILEIDPALYFSIIVLDEAHHVRNANAKITQDLRGILRKKTWALTGTPLERAMSDVWTILSVVEPRGFNLAYVPSSEQALRSRASPYVLRRMKHDYLPGLPPEIDEHETLELLPRQKRAYAGTLDRIRAGEYGGLLAGLNQLRTVCDFDQQSGQSIKLDRIMEITRAISSNDEKAVIFSYLLKPLDMLGRRLDYDGLGYVHLRGDQSLAERESSLRQFAGDAAISFLLASTRVGGEGLNLVNANHVIFINRWWNPSANKQAKDRVARLGQTKTVVIHSFTCRDTIEEDLDRIIQEKNELSQAVIESNADPVKNPAIIDHLTSLFSARR